MLQNLLQFDNLLTMSIVLAAAFAVYTLVSPYFEQDRLSDRLKAVSSERGYLRAAQKQSLDPANRLREQQVTDLYSKLVDRFRLNQVFAAEPSREMLRTAGYRNERHLTIFLVARAAMPIVCAIIFFVYSATIFSNFFNSFSSRIMAAMGGGVFGYFIPELILKSQATKRQDSIKRAWSDALDLMLICVESGMAMEPAITRVAKEIGSQSVPLAEELELTVAELAYLPERRKALENLAKRTGLDTVKSVVTAMIQADRYGTPLGQALRVLAEENRKDRMAEAEKKAAALPPKLTVPMIMFFLPVIFVVILGPSVLTVMQVR